MPKNKLASKLANGLARAHDGIAARAHDGIAARAHDGIAARAHDGIAARAHDGIAARASRRVLAIAAIVAALVGAARDARADATPNGAVLAALAPPAGGDDARKAVAIGPDGEVYEPDGKGTAWVRKHRVSTSNTISVVGRAGGAIVALGEGVVYRLAPNGWSAVRLHQKEKAVMSGGVRAVAAIGRQVFALERPAAGASAGTAAGDPVKLAMAPSSVLAIGAGAGGVIVQTERGLFRIEAAKVVPVKNAPRGRVERIVGDRWVLVDAAAFDLKTGRKIGWPPDVTIAVASTTADQRLVLVARARGKLELVIVKPDGKLEREPIDVPVPAVGTAAGASAPVGVAVDRAGRAVIALADGTLLVRGERAAWSATQVTDDLPGPRPGSPPAVSP